MKHIIFLISLLTIGNPFVFAKELSKPETIVLIRDNSKDYDDSLEFVAGDSIIYDDDFFVPVLLLNSNGDTIAPMGKYTLLPESEPGNDIIIVYKDSAGTVYVDSKGNELDYRPFIFDNGVDYVSEGFVRIVDKDGKMGYADSLGHVVIKPQFFFVEPWHNGYGRVAKEGYFKQVDEEHRIVVGEKWFRIDINGNIKPLDK